MAGVAVRSRPDLDLVVEIVDQRHRVGAVRIQREGTKYQLGGVGTEVEQRERQATRESHATVKEWQSAGLGI
jgi:hypothetical protein